MLSKILEILQYALAILGQQLGGKSTPINTAEALTKIMSAALAAFERETGQPMDISKIKPYEPME